MLLKCWFGKGGTVFNSPRWAANSARVGCTSPASSHARLCNMAGPPFQRQGTRNRVNALLSSGSCSADAEAKEIFAYLQTVPPPPPKLRVNVPKGELDQKTCAACHRRLQPTIVAQFEASAMGKPGRQNVRVAFPTPQITCAACQGTNHVMAPESRIVDSHCR